MTWAGAFAKNPALDNFLSTRSTSLFNVFSSFSSRVISWAISIKPANGKYNSAPVTIADIALSGCLRPVSIVKLEVPQKRSTSCILFLIIASFSSFIGDRKSTRLNSSHVAISYAVFCLKKLNKELFHDKASKIGQYVQRFY